MRSRICLVLALLIAVGAPAAAEPRSWTAIKRKVPATAIGVGGIDAIALQKSGLFQTLWAEAVTKDRIDQAGIDAVKAGCGVDAMAAIRDVSVVVAADDTAVMVLALNGVDQATFLRCAQAAVTHQGKGVVTAKKKGKVVEYAVDGTDRFFLAWLAPDVVAFANDSTDRKALEKLSGGKGARGALAAAIGKASLTAPGWFAFARPTPLENKLGIDGTLGAAYGTITLPAGKLDTKVTLVLGSADEASKLAAMVEQMLPVVAKQLGTQVPALGTDVATFEATAVDAEVSITGSISDSTLSAVVQRSSQLAGP